jgi:hypothetical protein
MLLLKDRHPSTRHAHKMLIPNPSLPTPLREISELCAELRDDVLARCGDGPELSAGLRKLLEAKDCFVRQALEDNGG